MTTGQRKLHVYLWLVLGPLALAGLALAVVLKPAEPVQDGPLPGVEVNAGLTDEPVNEDPGGGS